MTTCAWTTAPSCAVSLIEFIHCSYNFCNNYLRGKLHGAFSLRVLACEKIREGNPPVDFESGLKRPDRLFELGFEDGEVAIVDEEFFQDEDVDQQELILMRDLNNTLCQQIPELSYRAKPTFAIYDGYYWIHDPRFVSCYLIVKISRVLKQCIFSFFSNILN